MKGTTVILLAFTSACLGCSRNVAPPKMVDITGDDFMTVKTQITGVHSL